MPPVLTHCFTVKGKHGNHHNYWVVHNLTGIDMDTSTLSLHLPTTLNSPASLSPRLKFTQNFLHLDTHQQLVTVYFLSAVAGLMDDFYFTQKLLNYFLKLGGVK